MAKKEKKSIKDKFNAFNKKLNKVWLWTTLVTVGFFTVAGVYLGVKEVMSNKKEMVLKSLMEYNKSEFGYDASENPYAPAFPDCSYRYTKDFTDKYDTLITQCESCEILNYYDMIYLKIEGYTEDPSNLNEIFKDEGVAGWCVRNGVKYYYGAPDCPTTDAEQWILTKFSSESIEGLSVNLLRCISMGEPMLVSDSNYGTFFINSKLTEHLRDKMDEVDLTNMYIIIAEVMDSGWTTANAYEFMNSYKTIKENNV